MTQHHVHHWWLGGPAHLQHSRVNWSITDAACMPDTTSLQHHHPKIGAQTPDTTGIHHCRSESPQKHILPPCLAAKAQSDCAASSQGLASNSSLLEAVCRDAWVLEGSWWHLVDVIMMCKAW